MSYSTFKSAVLAPFVLSQADHAQARAFAVDLCLVLISKCNCQICWMQLLMVR